MDWLILISATALGIVVGVMVGITFIRLERLDIKALGSIIAIMAGGGVLALFQKIAGSNNGLPREIYAYPIGLLIGLSLLLLYNRHEKQVDKIRQGETERQNMVRQQRINEKQLIINTILHRVNRKTGRMDLTQMSYERLRELSGQAHWTDKYLADLVLEFPTELGVASVINPSGLKRPGIKVLGQSDTVSPDQQQE